MLILPATCKAVLSQAIIPALELLPDALNTPKAKVLLLAIGGQESSYKTRVQQHGPARGLWQFEPEGVQDVLNNSATRVMAHTFCAQLGVDPAKAYPTLNINDVLAAGFARMMLYCDPSPLPEVGDSTGAWGYYLNNWRPGKPRPKDWAANYAKALDAVNVGTG